MHERHQRLVEKVFELQICINIEVYVDEMVIKCRVVNMKLNLKKCLFGKKEENFLGHVITKEGIRATPRKGGITIRNELAEDGERVALGLFLSKSEKKTLPLYKALKKILDKKDLASFKKLKIALT
uniref:Reverse transcriptase domain-containing protein n=1 Tax=Lactuca sativa TaxID=4236 RepID=A0A9R1UL06_LACSA|nr:hypothetical protein LSAT_V11C800405830 [Lactuca sativa]